MRQLPQGTADHKREINIMDWDEARPTDKRGITTGEILDAASIAELEARIGVLEGEIVRVRAEIEKKRQRARAADAFFKS
jgi:uncharacterized small protein (DUF1192 family)